MKIDIHTHTRKCKTGDAPTRDIAPSDFCETVLSTDVRIVAVTNHNSFDLTQYQEIAAELGDQAQIWPGIELDIIDDGARGHLLVIAAPAQAASFSARVGALTEGVTPDNLAVSIAQVLETFDSLEPVYVAHYHQKKPALSDEAIGRLIAGTKAPSHVIKEATNSISAGIYISHGHASIYGSDVQDWANYEDIARDLPDLRLPVDSFEQFCLLLEKDQTTINTLLNRKTSEELVLQPFEDGTSIHLKVFNDINIIFGPKGTGKSCLLKAIAKHYAENGNDAKVYVAANDQLNEIFDMKGKDLTIDLNTHSISYCNAPIQVLRSAQEAPAVSVSKYVSYFASRTTNKNAKRLIVKDIAIADEGEDKRRFEALHEATTKAAAFLDFVTENTSVKTELAGTEHDELVSLVTVLAERLSSRRWSQFSSWKEITLLNSAIGTMRREVERKTGSPAKPTTTGFKRYALNRATIERSAAAIVASVESQIPLETLVIGSLGTAKGILERRTKWKFQDGSTADSGLNALAKVKKGTQKAFIGAIRKILAQAYADDLFQWIAKLNESEDVGEIPTVNELLLFQRYFALGGQPYSPSSGEASMVLLQQELERDGDIYILDEPERSLGNEYISEVIVPLIKERAKAGKKIFISTHDANIAVRTLPYCSVYRCHDGSGYSTFIGNPFSNDLVNSKDATDKLNWKKVSMRTLEGGEAAFGERGKIYGQA